MYSLPSYSFIPFIFILAGLRNVYPSFFTHLRSSRPEAVFLGKGNVLWKYAPNLQVNTHVEMRFQQSCKATLLKTHFGVGVLLHIFRTLIPKNTFASVTFSLTSVAITSVERGAQALLFYFVGCMVTKYTCVWWKFSLNKTTILTKNEYTYSFYSTAYPEECNLVRFEIGKLMETLLLM